MILVNQAPAATTKFGTEKFTVTAQAKLKIQTTGPGASDILHEGPPAGKVWTVTVNVDVKETDA